MENSHFLFRLLGAQLLCLKTGGWGEVSLWGAAFSHVARGDISFSSWSCGNSGADAAAAAAKSLQLCPTLCDPIDGSPPGSAIPGIL